MTGLRGMKVFCPIVCAVACAGTVRSETSVAEAKKLAAKIDEILLTQMRKADIRPAPQAENAVLFRRLYLDLAGRIPNLMEANDYLDDHSPNRTSKWIERLLSSDRYVTHFANVWRSILLPDKTDNQALAQQRSFESWMRQQLKSERSYDKIAKNLLTGLRQKEPDESPSAFYVAHGNKAEDMASATARVLLGVNLECAQCHAHPFADWSRKEFWRMAAFFNRRDVRYTADGRYLRPNIRIGDTKRKAQATFLDGTLPTGSSEYNGPTVLANWIATKENPYFSKAAVDHVWKYFFAASLFDPILRKDDTTKTHPDLLNMLASEFADHDFDLKYLIRSIVYSKTYQRSSRFTNNDSEALEYFARMPIRGLNSEQLYDSFIVATQIMRPDPPPSLRRNNSPFSPFANPRTEFLRKFAGAQYTTDTSIIQALFLMNGKFLSGRINKRKIDVFPVLAKVPIGADGRIRTLYMIVLSRPPRPEEVSRLRPHLEKSDHVAALADIYWALLNCGEFRLNH